MMLDRLATSMRRWLIAEALACAAVLLLTAAFAVGVMDASWPLSARVRLVLVLLALTVTGGLLARDLAYALKLRSIDVARQLQRRHPSLGSRLSNAVQLEPNPRSPGIAEQLRAQAVALGETAAAGIDVSEVRRQPRRRLVGVFLVLAAAVIAALLAQPSGTVSVAMRLIDPLGDHPPATARPITLNPLPETVSAGGSVTVTARRAEADRLDLVLLDPHGASVHRHPMQPQPDGTFRHTLVNLRQPVRFQVAEGHARTRPHHIGITPEQPSPDRPPTLTLLSPQRRLVMPDQLATIDVAITDDRGLAGIETLVQINGRSVTEPVALDGPRRHLLRHGLLPRMLAAEAGQTLTFRAAANDLAGQRAESDWVTVHVVTPAAHAAAVALAQERQLAADAAAALDGLLAALEAGADLPAMRARLDALTGHLADQPDLASALEPLGQSIDAETLDEARDRLQRAAAGSGQRDTPVPVVTGNETPRSAASDEPATGLLSGADRRETGRPAAPPRLSPVQATPLYVPRHYRDATDAYFRALSEARALGETPPNADNAR